jgi:hypothetical protein
MTTRLLTGLALLIVGPIARPALAQTDALVIGARGSDTVHVARPTGVRDADRASILAALARVRPGGTVQFAAGMYVVGRLIPVSSPRLTLLGHAKGTTLRGCDPAQYETMERAAVAAFRVSERAQSWSALSSCGMLELTGGHVTVRNFTFEYSRLGLLVGCCHREEVLPPSDGGYRIEGNTFRNTGNSIRAILQSSEPTVIRDNRFVDVYHVLSANVSHVHVLNNSISVPAPERVPGMGHPGFAIGLSARPLGDTLTPGPRCVHTT